MNPTPTAQSHPRWHRIVELCRGQWQTISELYTLEEWEVGQGTIRRDVTKLQKVGCLNRRKRQTSPKKGQYEYSATTAPLTVPNLHPSTTLIQIQETVRDRFQRLLDLCRGQWLTTTEIYAAYEWGVTKSTIYHCLQKLRAEGYLERQRPITPTISQWSVPYEYRTIPGVVVDPESLPVPYT